MGHGFARAERRRQERDAGYRGKKSRRAVRRERQAAIREYARSMKEGRR